MKIKDKGKYWDKAWQLVDGCTPVSAGCDNCWSASMAHRFMQGLTDDAGKFCGDIIIRESQEGRCGLPLRTKKPTVFAIWNDLFHESVPADFIRNAFAVMEVCCKHTFLVLTKRPELIDDILFGQDGRYVYGGGSCFPNIWIGTSVENQEQANKRIPALIKGADDFNKFLSIEPMLGEINLHQYFWTASGERTNAIQQVVCGGETGHNARPCHPDWVRSIRDQCTEAGVPFLFKGWGEWALAESGDSMALMDKALTFGHYSLLPVGNKAAGRMLEGRTHDDLVWGTK